MAKMVKGCLGAIKCAIFVVLSVLTSSTKCSLFNFGGFFQWIKPTYKPYTLARPAVTRPPSCTKPRESTIFWLSSNFNLPFWVCVFRSGCLLWFIGWGFWYFAGLFLLSRSLQKNIFIGSFMRYHAHLGSFGE